ncbi:MAG: imidazole glycerol phosphate synthase subunit HisH [Marinifilaceae bacterium]
MRKERIVIIDYGAGNVQSVKFAFQRLKLDVELTNDPQRIQSADRVIFPGVGEASSAMSALKSSGLDQLIPQLKQPVLGICLGMQLMCQHCEEGDTMGLGIFSTSVKRFPPEEKVPHMGWNAAEEMKGELFRGISGRAYFYFVHSYYVPLTEYTVATCDYIRPFSAALHKDNFFGCQFHPEKSGETGEKLLQNFLSV